MAERSTQRISVALFKSPCPLGCTAMPEITFENAKTRRIKVVGHVLPIKIIVLLFMLELGNIS